MATLAEIRAKLREQESRTSGNNKQSGGDNAIYPHWNMAEGSEAVLRFLPDADPEATFFWKERLMIKLPFAGIKGQTDSRPVTVNVPCMEMYGEACPVLQEVRGWFKDPSLEAQGRKYWKKRSYIFQGFVVDNPIGDDTTPENPIRRFIIGPQIFQIIKGALMDPEMEELPTDYVRGVDFRIKKTSKGGYADYSTSQWSRRERAVTEEEKTAIDTHGLHNLNDFLPKKPSDVEVKVIQQMFEASVDGEAYDPDRFGQYFRAPGMSAPTGDPNKGATAPTAAPASPAPTPAQEPVAEATPAPVAETATTTASATEDKPSSERANDILAMIRNRQQ
tara:strand:- start:690 stop:1691 length:1002 start_codon:yes stop_codon:yes gene_type:complete